MPLAEPEIAFDDALRTEPLGRVLNRGWAAASSCQRCHKGRLASLETRHLKISGRHAPAAILSLQPWTQMLAAALERVSLHRNDLMVARQQF